MMPSFSCATCDSNCLTLLAFWLSVIYLPSDVSIIRLLILRWLSWLILYSCSACYTVIWHWSVYFFAWAWLNRAFKIIYWAFFTSVAYSSLENASTYLTWCNDIRLDFNSLQACLHSGNLLHIVSYSLKLSITWVISLIIPYFILI
jgi:hypothetical protein